jgi:hypothetical protein
LKTGLQPQTEGTPPAGQESRGVQALGLRRLNQGDGIPLNIGTVDGTAESQQELVASLLALTLWLM